MLADRKGEIATLGSTLFWGSSFIAIKMGLDHIDPIPFAVIRFLFAALFSTIIYFVLKRRLSSSLLKNRLVYVLSLCNALAYLLQNFGIDLTTAIKASLLININLIFVLVISHFYLKERVTSKKLSAVFIGLIGITLVVTEGNFDLLHSGTLLGDFIVLGSGLAWACYLVLSRKVIAAGADIIELNYILMVLTALFLLPSMAVSHDVVLSMENMKYILYMAFFCTTIPFLLWTYGLKTISATTSSVLSIGEVIFASILSAIILKESLNAYGILGAGIIIAAITLMSFERKRKQPTRDY